MPNKDTLDFFQLSTSILPFVALWLIISWFLSRRSGWSQVASVYPLSTSFTGENWYFQNIRFGDKASYRGVLNVSANPHGVSFSILIPFRFGHSPFLIPWTDIQGYQTRKYLLGLVVENVEIRFAKTPQVECAIHGHLANELERISGGSWRYRRIGQMRQYPNNSGG